MEHLSQRDTQWGEMTLGRSTSKTKDFGCKMVSLAMMSYISPWECNQRLLTGGAFSGDLISDEAAATALSLTYSGKKLVGAIPSPTTPCIAEVDMSPAPGKTQHFVVWLGNGLIIDPWTGTKVVNPYQIISWRFFVEKKPTKEVVILKMMTLINSL